MSHIAIKAENLSKAYQLGEFSTGTLTRDIQRKFALMRGKEDPYLKIGETNDRTNKGTSDIVWSLKDINFEINQGDAVGIIGRNGAGKSTLLKVLSRVTTPTTGSVKIKGRVASLLEVGTGFHPELTGRENIFLNGAILGMRKHEIRKHFDAIVDFAGVERYIDTPVKRYSSGMYVRLAFAVAAHLESETLIVDEVLAVGDAEFQKKCLGKMNDVSKGEGRTVLFVSHNIASINTLTEKCIYLRNGQMVSIGETKKIVDEYINNDKKEIVSSNINHFRRNKEYASSNVNINAITCNGLENEVAIVNWDDNVKICVKLNVLEDNTPIICNVFLKNGDGNIVYSISSMDYNFKKVMDSSNVEIALEFTKPLLSGNQYSVDVGINHAETNKVLDVITDYPIFNVNDESFYNNWPTRPKGIILKPSILWE